MTKRRCRDKISEDGLTREEVLQMAMDKLQWSYDKVKSWYRKENAALNGSRPEELVDRGDTDRIVALLEKRESDRLKEQFNRSNRS